MALYYSGISQQFNKDIMKLENIEISKEIINLLEKTKLSKIYIEELLNKEKNKDKVKFNDGCYWLAISEHRDGSGINANLSRYFGNEKLLKVIIKELSDQIEFFETELKKL